MKRTLVIRIVLISGILVLSLISMGGDLISRVHLWGNGSDDTIPVLVADRYIPPFQIVKPAWVSVRRFPREYYPVGGLQSTSDLFRDDGQALYVSVVGIPEHQPLTHMVLNEAGRDKGMSSLLKPGKVAISFQVERSRAAGGWIRPGDTIALFRSLPPEALMKKVEHGAPLLMESIQVLAVDHEHVGEKAREEDSDLSRAQQLTQQESDTQILTVLANTQQAAAIVEARERGPLSVVLRSMGDDMPWYGGEKNQP